MSAGVTIATGMRSSFLNLRPFAIIAGLLVAVFTIQVEVAQADLYWCIEKNDPAHKLVEVKLPGAKCKLVEKNSDRERKSTKPSSKTAKRKAPGSFPSVSTTEQTQRDNTRTNILQHELHNEIKHSRIALSSVNQAEVIRDARRFKVMRYIYKRHLLNIMAIKQELARLK